MYLYLQPRGGLNDILCRIGNAISYCKKHSRILLIDTVNSNYSINFSDYFYFEDDTVIYEHNEIRKILANEKLSVFPNVLQNKMLDIIDSKIKFKFTGRGFKYGDVFVNLPYLKRDEDIIVLVECGGGNGYQVFKNHIFIRPFLIEYCKENYLKLTLPYLCIQVRNTDYKCNYEGLYENNKELIEKYSCIYVATDDKNVITFFKSKGLNVYNFTEFPENDSRNLHISDVNPDRKIKDVISDLYIIMMSDKLLSNSKGGFINLVRRCKKCNIVKEKFIKH